MMSSLSFCFASNTPDLEKMATGGNTTGAGGKGANESLLSLAEGPKKGHPNKKENF